MPRVSRDYHRTLYFADPHVPDEDPVAWGILLDFTRWWRPDTIINLGDTLDFPQISKFDHDPLTKLRVASDLARAIELQADIRAAAPNAELIYCEGNHDNRWQKHLWRDAVISQLEQVALQNLLLYETFGIHHVPMLETYVHRGVLIEHGDCASKHGGYTAKAMLEKRGWSGLSGHTHRLANHEVTKLTGTHFWRECGCLCKLTPAYMRNPNWQQAFVIGYDNGIGRHEMHDIHIADGLATYNMLEFGEDAA